MRKILVSTSIAALLGPSASIADPTYMLGIGLSFGGNQSPQFALTGKILSDDEEDEAVLALGLNYYPNSGEIGADLGVGYLFDNSAVVLGYDFLQKTPLLSLGFADTDDGASAAPATTVAPTTPPLTTPPPP